MGTFFISLSYILAKIRHYDVRWPSWAPSWISRYKIHQKKWQHNFFKEYMPFYRYQRKFRFWQQKPPLTHQSSGEKLKNVGHFEFWRVNYRISIHLIIAFDSLTSSTYVWILFSQFYLIYNQDTEIINYDCVRPSWVPSWISRY